MISVLLLAKEVGRVVNWQGADRVRVDLGAGTTGYYKGLFIYYVIADGGGGVITIPCPCEDNSEVCHDSMK